MGQIRRDKEDPNRLEGYTEKIRNWILLRFMSFDSSLQWQTDAGEPAHAAVEISAHSAFDLRITMEKDLDVLGWKSVSVDLRTDYSTTMSKVRVLKLFPISAKLKEEDSEPEKELGGLTQEDADRVLKLGKKLS
ncbi:hypothetical protein B0A48_13302 [Cryoendolithus antarcticus]|uniref:Uncharacterized protein n=1 Tax=Cryoendolithus antarcticus TaxID=1507870 RepID=A0A1V8SPN3_9PEZI|nr:hypothetical protein B0A48_13302 [Cryoendolithus antarcticus]